WLSLKNAQVLVQKISDTLGQIDSEGSETYSANAEAYINKLKQLDGEYADAVAAGAKDTVLFGDRFPFRYLTDDYGLTYFAAFVGCSAETEASFETVVFLANKVDELGLDTVLTIEGSDHRIAETIISNTASKDQTVAVMDSMQSTTSSDVSGGATYLSIMEKNLEVLSGALK
ncbi:MAG: zinc ABC transporter substrate-binding protein, partial [Oscillospiraceae bacterium]|nr:zinc ABC transporter substrate-binding protein [Oscillospiraceae bacterium]